MINNKKVFHSIKEFVSQLDDVYGDDIHSLKLYQYLLTKTNYQNKKAVKKHIRVFKIFCDKNSKAILAKDKTIFKLNKIKYSERVNIDISEILKISDSDTELIIWQHLLHISGLLNPNSEAIDLLKKSLGDKKSNENSFLKNIPLFEDYPLLLIFQP